MKCVVPGANVKILAKAIHSLAKIGDEMYVEPQETGISFRTVNMARSAYASFTFAESYFSYYTYGNLEEDDALRCQITMRSAMAVFKAPGTLDRQIETCEINLEARSCKLLFILKYRNGITKTHFLPIIDCQILQAVFPQKSASNQLIAQHKVLSDVMQNFQQLGLIEITLEVTPQKVLIRNYVDDTSDLSKVTRTQLALSVGEFEQYQIGADTSITFCVKEFKAVLNFAEAVSLPVGIHFETAGKPAIFLIKSPTFETKIVLSTLNPDVDSQSDASTVPLRERTVLKKTTASKRKSTKTNGPTGRKMVNGSKKFKATKNTNTHTAMEITNVDVENINKNTRPKAASSVDTNEDYLLASVSENLSMNTDEAPRKSVFSKKFPGARSVASTSSVSEDKFPSNPSPILNSKKIGKSIFSTIINQARSESSNEDCVPNSPPRQTTNKAKVIFKKCFQTTFDPRMLPGHDVVLAEDTDESD